MVLYCEAAWRLRIGDVATDGGLAAHISMKHGLQWLGMPERAGRSTSAIHVADPA